MLTLLSKIHTVCHHIANIIKTESKSKMNDKHAVEYSKTVCWGHKVICVRCINCSYNNIAKDICLLDKIANMFIQENLYTSKSF